MSARNNLRLALLVVAIATIARCGIFGVHLGHWGHEPTLAPLIEPTTSTVSVEPVTARYSRSFGLQSAELAAAIQIQERVSRGLLRSESVLATAIGISEGGGPAIHIYVVDPSEAVAQTLPGLFEGLPVVIRQSGEFRPISDLPIPVELADADGDEAVNRAGRFDRPVPLGVSTGHPKTSAGTIGALVTDGKQLFALSNNHVLAATNMAGIGDVMLQPGIYDGGRNPTDAIGTLAAFRPIGVSLLASNRIDAAIATTDKVQPHTSSEGYGTPKAETLRARPGMNVKKYGRTTGLTHGRVDAINTMINVRYPSGVARFTGQVIICCGTSAGGDSGSLIVADDVDKQGNPGPDDRKPVALLFAGDGRLTIANPIDEVLDAFGVTIVGDDN